MFDAAVGIFDSGLGGLTAVREFSALAPNENIIYFGDTGRVPYGTRSRATIVKYARQDVAFLLSRNVKYIISACGTVSANLPDDEASRIPVPFTGVIRPAARAAAAATKNGKVGIIGTVASVNSGAYAREIAALAPDIKTVSNACPLFVPLVEYGYRSCEMTRLAAAEYLAPLREAGVDTLIMGCTHYPLIRDVIAQYMGNGVTLIDAGAETARFALSELDRLGLRGGNGKTQYFVTDDSESFSALASAFLGREVSASAQKIDIESL